MMGSVPASRWRKSSYSSNGGDCVELAAGAVRDSKNPAGPALRADVHHLMAAIKAGVLAR